MTEKTVVLASCDELYFYHHVIPFTRSCIENDNGCIVTVVNPSEKCTEYMALLSEEKGVSCIAATEIPPDGASDEEKRAFYSCSRFYEAELLLNTTESPLYIVDIDCIIRKKLPILSEDFGVFIRRNEPDGWKTAAGLVYVNNTDSGHRFIHSVVDNIRSLPLEWYADQRALWQAYNEIKPDASIREFTQKEMNWEFFDDEALIWTGKGPRKDNSKAYLAEKFRYAVAARTR